MGYEMNNTDLNRIWGRKHITKLPFSTQQIDEALREKSKKESEPSRPRLSFDIVDAKQNRLELYPDIETGGFLLTPFDERDPEIPALEWLSLSLAQVCKIPIVPPLLIPTSDDKWVFIVRKNDTKYDNSTLKDVHTLLGKEPGDLYNATYEEIAKSIYQSTYNPVLEIVRFYEMLLVGFILGHSDMHLKSFALQLHTNDKHSLASAYDMIAANITHLKKEDQLALTLNGKKRDIRLDDFIASMEASEMPDKASYNLIVRIASGLQKWKDVIDASPLSDKVKSDLIEIINTNALKVGMRM